jgi:hypothetical protein
MPNEPGDHPLTDLMIHGISVYSPEADALIRDIARYLPGSRLNELFDWFGPPPLGQFTEASEPSETTCLRKHAPGVGPPRAFPGALEGLLKPGPIC